MYFYRCILAVLSMFGYRPTHQSDTGDDPGTWVPEFGGLSTLEAIVSGFLTGLVLYYIIQYLATKIMDYDTFYEFGEFEKMLMQKLKKANRDFVALKDEKSDTESKLHALTSRLYVFVKDIEQLKKMYEEIKTFKYEYDKKGYGGLLAEKINERVVDTLKYMTEAETVIDALRELAAMSVRLTSKLTSDADTTEAALVDYKEQCKSLEVRSEKQRRTTDVIYTLLRDEIKEIKLENDRLKKECELLSLKKTKEAECEISNKENDGGKECDTTLEPPKSPAQNQDYRKELLDKLEVAAKDSGLYLDFEGEEDEDCEEDPLTIIRKKKKVPTATLR